MRNYLFLLTFSILRAGALTACDRLRRATVLTLQSSAC